MKTNDSNEKKQHQRKLDHIEEFLKTKDGPLSTGFEDLFIPHQAFPSNLWSDVSLSTLLFNKNIDMPLIINALTGGPHELLKINSLLAEASDELGIGMAVGSQSLALEDRSFCDSFTIVRKKNPEGLIIANVSANIIPQKALEAVEMIEADALQLHLNIAQELFMEEGDRDFCKLEENIFNIVRLSPVEVIVKEIGFGISKESAEKISKLGVKWLDIGGAGGTNFITIESRRGEKKYLKPPIEWGIPTAASLLEVKGSKADLKYIASGGVRSALDIIKSFALGAEAVAIAGPLLRIAAKNNLQELIKYLSTLQKDVERLVFLCGAKTSQDMKNKDMIITGKMKEWQLQRKL